jgi:hypothetical protein
MTSDPGGTRANKYGAIMERFILSRFADLDYVRVPRGHFTPACALDQPIFTQHFHVGQSIYGTPQYCDFIVYHPAKWPKKLIIEAKWQQSGGSVDEKYPYLVLNIQMKYQSPTILILDGGGYKKGAERWIRSQVGHGNFLAVFNMPEFAKWVNNGNL